MSQDSQIVPPPVIWAQRAKIVYVTICLEDCKDPTIKVEADKIYFKGVGGTDKKNHEVTINLYKEIDPEQTVQNDKGRLFEFILTKKEEGPFWPRLTKENKKYHWLKSDFNKWKDEEDTDDSETEQQPRDMNNVMQNMLWDMPKGKPSFDDMNDMCDEEEAADSDDDEIPDLE